MAVHVRLKNEFTEDEKYHNLTRGLKDVEAMANNVDPDSGTVLVWVCSVCSNLSGLLW